MHQKSDLVAIKEVAEFLNLADKTIYRMAADGDIPAFKIGGSWRFRMNEIEVWLDVTVNKIPPVVLKNNPHPRLS